LSGSHRHHQRIETVLRVCDRDTAQVQEHQGCGERYALVAIDERMILAEMERVRGGHLIEISMKVLALEGSLRDSDCGTDKADVTYAEISAISRDLVPKYREYF